MPLRQNNLHNLRLESQETQMFDHSALQNAFRFAGIRLVSSILAASFFLSLVTGHSGLNARDESPTAKADQAINQAIDWIFSMQADDGGWHSEYYGALRSGAATTSLTLYALSNCPPDKLAPHRASILKARDFLLENVKRKGYVTNADGPDYVTYGSAMLLIADDRLKLELDERTRKRLRDFLITAQLGEKQNYHPGEIDFGGWDLMGWARSPRKSAGTNVSVSASALEALALFDSKEVVACRERATEWLATCRADDGGYFFHPRKDHDGNKAGWTDGDQVREHPRSYGTATCDALRCMLALKIDPSDREFRKTVEWIESLDQLDEVPGFESEEGELGWRTGLHYYFLHSLSRTLTSLSDKRADSIATEIAELLTSRQTEKGFWQNDNARMREDDPLIATGLALVAICNARKVLAEEQD